MDNALYPCDACRLPRTEKAKTCSIQGKEVSAFLDAIKGDPYEHLYFVTLFTGMRQGEIIGLTWDCVDFDKSLIRVEKQFRKDHSSGSTYQFSTLKNGKTRAITPAPVVFDVLRKVKAKTVSPR